MFKLADYYHAGKLNLVNELATEYTFVCPVCGGKLKCRKDNNAYRCYSNYCDANTIRTKLGASPITISEHKPPPLTSFIRPVIATSLDPPIKLTTTYQLPKLRKLSDRTITTFIFSTLSCVERVDYVDKSRKKELYPKYRTNNTSSWTYGRSNNFGLYGSSYVGTSGSVLMTEGEKCADYIMQNTDYVCLSAPTFAQEDVSYIASNLTNPKITSVIFLPDNDERGRKKANAVMQACWAVGKPCFIFDYGEAAHTMSDGDDIVDIAGRGYDIRRLIYDYCSRYIN